ncbi:MAG: hypothetical protein ACFE96_09825, partial [Candidatus Hermodarchaeota archaeon]
MSRHLFNKKQKLFFLIFLTCGMTITLLGLPLFNSISFDNNFEKNSIFDFDNHKSVPKTMDYQNYRGTGEQLDVILHQSYLNNTFNTAVNTSDSNNNKLNIVCPTEPTFNSSYARFEIEDIQAPNKTLVMETGTSSSQDFADDWAFSFEVPGNCTLNSFTIALSEVLPLSNNAFLGIYLYGASWDSTYQTMRPNNFISNIDTNYQINDGASAVWYNLTNINEVLDVADTNNNTFFIYITQNTPSTQAVVEYHYEADGSVDNSKAWRDFSGTWTLYTRDPSLSVFLTPLNNTPRPEQVNLKIDNQPVKKYNDIDNTGFWESLNVNSSATGELQYTVSADWWDVTCNVAQVQINYTKTDIKAISSFNIEGSGIDVNWNVTVPSGLNYFDPRITDFNTINFTIPRIWNNPSIKVFNGATDKTSDLVKRLINSNYREVQVLNAGNGTYWYLNATSSNLFSSINTFVSGIARSMVNHSNIVRFNTTFSELIYDGILNLSVFTPSQGYLNHTRIFNLTPLGADTEFTVSDWDVSVNVTEYGVFKIQMSWNNDTAAGFLEDYITIVADTDLTLTVPQFTFDSGDVFNMTVFFEDTGQTLGVQADDIYYQINAGPERRDNIFYNGNGYYNITISCNDAQFGYGPNIITVNAEKTYYNNQTNAETINILAETDAYIVFPFNGKIYDSGDTFDLMIYYNDTIQDTGITGATVDYSLDGGVTYRQDNVTPLGPGQYNITISASDSDFNGYGVKPIIVNISKLYYYNHSESINIMILGETSLSAVRIPNQAYYTAAETFSISIYYRDIVKDLGIIGADVDVDVDGTVYNPTISDNLDGYYNITIDCSDAIFSNYKVFAIRVNVSLENYYNQTTTLNTLIVGNESLTVLAPNSGAVYIIGQSFDITIEYIDTILST